MNVIQNELLFPSYLPGEEEPASINAHHKHLWETKFLELEEYKKENNGSTSPPIRTTIGSWAQHQRLSHKKGQLSKYRTRRLDEIGFDWVLSPHGGIPQDELLVPSYLPGEEEPASVKAHHKHLWETMFLELEKYKKENNGSTSPPIHTTIGSWARRQRTSHNKGQLSKYRTRRLDEIGYDWIVSPHGGISQDDFLVPSYLPGEEELTAPARHKHLWETMFLELERYKKENSGSTSPPAGTKLGNWAHTQRKLHNKGQLSKYRTRRLNEIGFAWKSQTTRTIRTWENNFQKLIEYKEKYGDTNVPLHYKDDLQLGSWCYTQNYKYWEGTLKPERASCLDGIGFEWKEPVGFDHRWNEKYSRLKEYKNKFGDTNVPFYYDEDKELANWVHKQRAKYDLGDLSKDMIQRLDEIGFVWEPHEAAWEEMYKKLINYKDKFGNTEVHEQWDADSRLGIWVRDQRRQYRIEDLSDDRIMKLEEIGFVWEPFEVLWMRMYNRLIKYKNKFGDTHVPSNYVEDPELSHWVCYQRQSYRKGRLADDRIKMLEEVDFNWKLR